MKFVKLVKTFGVKNRVENDQRQRAKSHLIVLHHTHTEIGLHVECEYFKKMTTWLKNSTIFAILSSIQPKRFYLLNVWHEIIAILRLVFEALDTELTKKMRKTKNNKTGNLFASLININIRHIDLFLFFFFFKPSE